MNAQISEIFSSIQGEGKYAGIKQLFLRFFGCPLNCVWCDTPQAKTPKGKCQEYSSLELFKKVYPAVQQCHSVSLTGGEPLAQVDFLKHFLPQLKKKKIRIYLETNGVLPNALSKVIPDVDIVSMDIKLPSSTGEKAFWKEHEQFLKIALRKDVFVKAVISHKTKRSDVLKMVRLVARINPRITCILQPQAQDLQRGVIQKCLRFQDDCLKELFDVRIVPQWHKILKVR